MWAVGVILFALLSIVAWRFFNSATPTDTDPATTQPVRSVAVAPAASLSTPESVVLIGSVSSLNRAQITSEAAGRVVRVPVQLGQRVAAGTVIAQLENASERAAVVQAEGAYEAAQAAAAQNTIGVTEAENNVQLANTELRAAKDSAVTVVRDSFSTANNVVKNTVDQFFSSPERGINGLRIDGQGYTRTLVDTRADLRSILPTWRDRGNQLTSDDNLTEALSLAEENTRFVLEMVDIFIAILPDADPTTRFSAADLAAAQSSFAQARSSLTNTLAAIDRARTTLSSAEEAIQNAERALERAEIGGSGGAVSAADAQVKQALGALQAAQATLAQTTIRTPIAGEVNALNVRTGDYVSARDVVAEVANNAALEITTYVGERDRDRIAVGDPVTIGTAGVGTISTIAPAVSERTGKVEVKVHTTDPSLQTGDTVDLTITDAATTTENPAISNESSLLLPITAIRFTAENGYVFTVSNEDTLVRRDVTLGAVRGDQVEVLDGIDRTTEIVVDARGLAVGAEIDPLRN